MIAAVCLAGWSACTEPLDPEPAPAPEQAAKTDRHDDELPTNDDSGGGGACCIDYSCPTDGFEATGCKNTSFSFRAAYEACDAACDVACKSSGLHCD